MKNNNLTKAKVQLILSSPFYATIALSLRYIEDTNIPTACTDGKSIRYNPSFFDSLTKDEIVAVLAHEVLHIVNLHHLRLQGRDHSKFNEAADYAINYLLQQSNFKLPKDALLDSRYNNKSAEEIYNLLPANDKSKSKKGKSMGEFEQGDQQTESQVQEETVRVKTLVAKAATVGRQQGNLPSFLDRLITNILKPKVNWKEKLVRFMTDISNSDYTWIKPNRRYMPVYLPSLEYIAVLGEIVLIVDTSGSIDSKILDSFAAEISEICTMMNKPLSVIYVDTKVASVQKFDPEDHVILNPKGGGGTDFVPGFDYIEKADMSPACVIYFTDGYCNSFPSAPDYPVMWATYNNNNFNPPFGEVLEVE